MKRIISTILIVAVAVSMFCVSFASNAAESVTLTFHANNTMADADCFRTLEVSNGGAADSFYDVPNAGEGFIFKGWYYGREEDAEAVSFDGDTFTEDTDIYAHWAEAGVVVPDGSDPISGEKGTYDGFDLTGAQLKAGAFTDEENGGLRFIGSLSNSLLAELDSLSNLTVGEYSSRVEYGFIAARKTAVESWKDFGANKGYDLSDYKIGYNGTDVNGVDTTRFNANYQRIVSNIDCTASDYSQSDITDFDSYNGYRLYSLAVTYPGVKQNGEEYTAQELEEFRNADVAVRAYLRYYDANGLLRTVYDEYNGTNTYGGLCTSYEMMDSQSVVVGYYSTLSGAKNDANSLTVANADSNQSDAICSMYISGGRAYIKLLRDVTQLSSVVRFEQSVDLNLNNCTVNTGAYRITSIADFDIYNGTYEAGASAQTLSTHGGNLTKITNVRFTAPNLTMANQFNGVLVQGKAVYLNDCEFDICASASDKSCYGSVFFNTKYADVSGCTYNISSAANFTSTIYSNGSALKVDGSNIEIEQTAQNTNATAYGIQAWDDDSAVLKNSTVTISGDYDNACGVLAKNSDENDDTSRFFSAYTVTVNMDIDDLYKTGKNDEDVSVVRGLSFGKGETAQLTDVDVAVNAKAPLYAIVNGIRGESDADITLKGSNVTLGVTEIDSAADNGRIKGNSLKGICVFGTSRLTVYKAKIIVPMGCITNTVDYNHGIYAAENSTVYITPENDNDVFIRGGNAALSNTISVKEENGVTTTYNSKFYITGGMFCSPSHGGGYFGGDTVITGGRYFVIDDRSPEYDGVSSTYFPNEGGMYVTNNAVVDISGATINGGKNGIRTKSNSGRTDNPTVTISNTNITAVSHGVSSSAGEIILNEGVTITANSPKYTDSSGTITDNR